MKNSFDEKWSVELFRQAAAIVEGLDVFPPFAGGVGEDLIKKQELALGLPIRGSYREFLLRFGAQQDEGFEGIDTKFGCYLSERTRDFWEDGLPGSHIVVFFEGSTCYSMDTSQPTTKDEYAVFEFDFEDPKVSANSSSGTLRTRNQSRSSLVDRFVFERSNGFFSIFQ